MADDPLLACPRLPARFPCWCRAKFSWSGESKRDLGFGEGDLIECLNAGDGQWWVGRLFRDKRVRGIFPSNFVAVLPRDFQPTSRGTTPIPSRSPSPNPFNAQPSSKPFRKPFQAYAAPDPGAQKRAEIRQQEGVSSVSRTPSPAPRTPRNRDELQQSPPRRNSSRAPSPTPYLTRMGAPSPELPDWRDDYESESFATTSGIFSDEAECDSPPPPPPPHRTNFRAQTSTGFYEHRDQYASEFQRPQSITPDAHTPERNGHTPSPLTHAMNDVMLSLEDMGISEHSALSQREITTQINLDPWDSAAAYDAGFHVTPTKLKSPVRPSTSIGIGREPEHLKNRPGHRRSRTDFSEEPPQLSNYVERMESRLGRMKRGGTPHSEDLGSEDGVAPDVPPKAGFFRSKSPFGRPKSPFGRPKSPFGRPKSPFGRPKSPFGRPKSPFSLPKSPFTRSNTPPMPPPPHPRSKSAIGDRGPPPVLRQRKSAYEVGKAIIGRTFTNKSSSTNYSSGQQSVATNTTQSTQATDRSLMSGQSAGAYSATSAGSYARKQAEKYGRAQSALGIRRDDFDGSRPETPFTGVTYHSSHASSQQARSQSQAGWRRDDDIPEMPGLGGLVTPKAKKSGFFKRMVESAKTGAANARSSIAVGEFVKPNVPPKSAMPDGVKAIAGGVGNSFGTQYKSAKDAAKDMGLGGGTGIDWVQVRRDVNRSNSLSRIERAERKDRCLMMDLPAIEPLQELSEATDGDQGGDNLPVVDPINFQTTSLALVDKNARFINSLPPMTSPVSLATGFVCRPYKTNVQRLRAIFTWCAEKILWEDDFEGDVDVRRVISTRRGGTEEIVFLVLEMCQAVNIPCNVIRGYLKIPGEVLENGRIPNPNHFWNSVLVDNEWRIMDCSLASPSHPKRGLYSGASNDKAESFYFLARPMEICWTHVPEYPTDQHLVPPVLPEILLSLPVACPPFFRNMLEMVGYDTSITRIEDLEVVQLKIAVPVDVECAAEVESLALSRDQDGDLYETDAIARQLGLSQAVWYGGKKHFVIKAILPPNGGSHGILKVYAGKRGLNQSIKQITHPLAFALPILHEGDSSCDGYEFVTRYPTPHSTRHDLYVVQPQCRRLVVGNTFVFAVRQHTSSLELTEEAVSEVSGSNRDGGRSPIPGLGSRDGNRSPLPLIRPGSAMSVTNSNSASGAGSGTGSLAFKQFTSAKLAIQAPGGKILRLQRKEERMPTANKDGVVDLPPDGKLYETIIKCGEKGPWRALVLADRSARWCVFAEWNCV